MINIYFDFEIENHVYLEDLNIPEREKSALIRIKNFIYQRVIVLEDDDNLQPNGYIYYRLDPPKIEYRYDYTLASKMNSCITETDQQYISTQIQSGFLDLFN